MSGLFVLIFGLGCVFGTISLLNGQVIGGVETKIEEFPYQASLNYKGQHVCGGALISEGVVVTAAHCVYGRPHCKFQVQLGCTRLSDKGVRMDVKEIIPHEGFNMLFLKHDIALVVLVKRLQFSDTINPIALPEYKETFGAGAIGVVTGWNNRGLRDPESDLLQYVVIRFLGFQKCQEIYKEEGFHLSPFHICATVVQYGNDSCDGESGGPVFARNALQGIVSWKNFCGDKKLPRVYLRISEYVDWIQNNSPDYFIHETFQ